MAGNLKKILVTSCDYPDVGMNILQGKVQIIQSKLNGFESNDLNKAEIEKLIPGVDGVIWITKVPLGKELLDKAGPQLKVVSAMSAGVDHIDKNEIKSRGIVLGNTPSVLNAAVADVAMLLMTAASRRVKEGLEQIKTGAWELGPQAMLGRDIKGSTVGIIGLGGIGQTIARRLKGYEVQKIIYTGHKEIPEAKEFNAIFVTLDELLKQSDFVFVSCAYTENTKNLINAAAFAKMKNTAILINVSRGGVLDQEALINALKNKQIYAAGIDVTSPEPLPANSELVSLPNCFITPHIGSATVNTRNEMAQLASLNAILGVEGEPILTPVN